MLWKHWTLNGRTMWGSSFRTKALDVRRAEQIDGAVECRGRIKERRGKLFQGWCVWNDNCCPPLPSALSLPLYQTPLSLSPALNLIASMPRTFQTTDPCVDRSVSLTINIEHHYPFPVSSDTRAQPPNQTWGHTVYKGQGWVAAGEWENKWFYLTQARKK